MKECMKGKGMEGEIKDMDPKLTSSIVQGL